MFAGIFADEHDKDRSDALEPAEVQALKAEAFDFIAEYNYFSFVKIDGKPFQVRYVTDFEAILQNGRLAFTFFIPCHVTAGPHPKRVDVGTYDPTFYTSIFFARDDSVTLYGDEPFAVDMAIREDPDTAIFFDMVHPRTLFLEFWAKS